MHRLVKMRAIFAWLVLLSMLFSGLAPAMSHAMAAATQHDEELQVCTMGGMKTIVIQDFSGKSVPPDHMLKHCSYCASHASTAHFLASTAFVFRVSVLPGPRPTLFHESATPLFAWTSPAPRGPPVLV